MKRLLSLMTVCALLCTPAFGQDEPVSNVPELSIVSRIDYPFSPYVYTLLDGNLGKYLSYSFSNLWVNDDLGSLYANTLRSDEADWCQWAYVTLNLGNWHIQAGKNYIFTGGFEVDAYDFDQYWQLCSNFWNNTQVYQYGGALQYVTPSESDTFTLQVLSSPFSAKPFDDALLSYSAEWRGEHGIWSTIWGVTGIDYDADAYSWGDKLWLISAGNQFQITDNFSLGVDYMYRIASPFANLPGAGEAGPFYPANDGHNVVGRINWQPLDWFEIGAKGVYETSRAFLLGEDLLGIPESFLNGGLFCNFYPFGESLRLHALAGMNNIDGFYWGAGVTWNFNVSDFVANLFGK